MSKPDCSCVCGCWRSLCQSSVSCIALSMPCFSRPSPCCCLPPCCSCSQPSRCGDVLSAAGMADADVRNVGLAECRAECAVLLWRRWAGLAGTHTTHAVVCLWMLWAMLLVSHVLVSMRMRAVAGCLDRRLAPTDVVCLQFGCSCAAENAALWLWLWRFRAVMAHLGADCWHAAALHYCCCSMSRLLPGTRPDTPHLAWCSWRRSQPPCSWPSAS
ncbi:hypothetical protein BC831DRAFT_75768 [Entophlyctis helioformis]|nr:hypothetical protein BC831DRAFT_75768 [Entophlyctis helioformis]